MPGAIRTACLVLPLLLMSSVADANGKDIVLADSRSDQIRTGTAIGSKGARAAGFTSVSVTELPMMWPFSAPEDVVHALRRCRDYEHPRALEATLCLRAGAIIPLDDTLRPYAPARGEAARRRRRCPG